MLWRPQGVTDQDSGRWDSHPERMTYFLELLANEKREGRFLQGNPNNTHYNLLIRSFWEKFKVYHTKPQFKNHFTAKKQLWNLLCWAQNCTGISWDDQRKMVIASPDWWESNKERKGLTAIKDKSIPDYDLLEMVFRGQHAEGAYMRDPHVPRFPRAEVVGDSDSTNPANLSDTQGIGSPANLGETPGRRIQSSEPRRKKRNTSTADKHSSPIVENLNTIMGSWFDRMTEARVQRQESRTIESVNNQGLITPVYGSLQHLARILLGEMKMDATSEMFQQAQEMLGKDEFLRAVLLEQQPETRWPWLMNTLNRHNGNVATPSKPPGPARSDC